VVYFDLILLPDTYKCDGEFSFGIHLNMFYKIFKSLQNDVSVEIEADESIMKINQCQHYHTLVSQEVPPLEAEVTLSQGVGVEVSSKMFQKYIRALGNIAPAVEINHVPGADVLFLESVNSMYRTLFSIDTSTSPSSGEEYKKQFMIKFLEMVINPSLSDKMLLILGDSLHIHYHQTNLTVDLLVAAYTEG
jgi:hypothetical protein